MQVCLSISSHHPEHWQPSWSVRTALVALIAFMQTPGNGAIGSLVRLLIETSIVERTSVKGRHRSAPSKLRLVRASLGDSGLERGLAG